MNRNKNIPPLPASKPYRGVSTKSQQGERSGLVDNQPHNMTANDHEISNDMLDVLKQQNTNLKTQNLFLLGKLRIFADKESHYQEIQKKYQGIVGELRNKNKDLQDQLKQLNELTQVQMKKLNQKISQIALEQNHTQSVEKSQGKIKDFSLSAFMQTEQIHQKPHNQTMTSRQLQHLGTEFNKLVLEGKQELQITKRRQIRKRMMQISKKMKEIKKLNEL